MRSAGLYRQLAQNKQLLVDGIIRPAVNRTPICRKCNKPVDYVAIEDRGPDPDYPSWFEVRVKCHGKEDFSRVECRSRLKPDMWATVVSTGNFFDPSHEDSGFSGYKGSADQRSGGGAG